MTTKKQEILTPAKIKKALPFKADDLKLKPKELQFATYYCQLNFNAAEAYSKIKPDIKSRKRLYNLAQTYLKKPNIIIFVQRYIDNMLKDLKNSLKYSIIDIYYQRAFYKINYFYDEDGVLIPLDKIEEKHLYCIDGIERKFFGKDAEREVTTYELADREKALQHLWKYIEKYNALELGKDKTGKDVLKSIRKKVNKSFDVSDFNKWVEKFEKKAEQKVN